MTRIQIIARLKEEHRKLCAEQSGSSLYLVVVFIRGKQVERELLSGDRQESDLLAELNAMLDRGGKAIGFVGGCQFAANEIDGVHWHTHHRLFPKYARETWGWARHAISAAEESLRAKLQPFPPYDSVSEQDVRLGLLQMNSGVKTPLTIQEQEVIRIAIAKAGGRRILRGQSCFACARDLSIVPSNPPILYHEGVVWGRGVFTHHAWVTISGKIYDPLYESELRDRDYFGIRMNGVSSTVSGALTAGQVEILKEYGRDVMAAENDEIPFLSDYFRADESLRETDGAEGVNAEQRQPRRRPGFLNFTEDG
jgi:hypothetical protein